MEVLILNPDLDFWNFDAKVHFRANLGPKIQSCPICLKIGTNSISRTLIPNPALDFWNFDPKVHFWANLGPNSQSFPFHLKIGTHGISSILILIPTLCFWISNPNFLFGQIWAKKVKVVRFNWKLAHVISRGCWFLFQHQSHEIPTSFFGKFGPEKSKLFVLSKSSHKWYLEDADSYFNICFLNFQLKNHFWPNLSQSWVKFVNFAWKLAHLVSWRWGLLFQD